MKQIAEQAITPQLLKKIAPDVTEEKAVAKQVAAGKIKDMMDKALALAANKLGGTSNSRIKDVDTIKRKIAQKRLQGRDYDIEDINDAYGGRIIIDKSKKDNAIDEVRQMEKAGLFKIKKEESIKDGEYRAYHFDIQTPNGTKGEIQIHHPQSALEAVSNHTLRAEYGDMPKGHIVSKLKGEQRDRAYETPNPIALAKIRLVQSLEKKQDGKTYPMQTALILASNKL